MSEQTANRTAKDAPLSAVELTGRVRTHVGEIAELRCVLHPQAGAALRAMRAAAARDGLDLWPVSGFRDFAHQLAIWNAKYRGERPLLDRNSLPLRSAELRGADRIAAILIWSALPGASRHHWGSECDVIDRRALASATKVELLSADFAAGGRYAPLADWLAAHARGFGFFHPYDRDRGGVQPEPWHLSFAPVALPALQSMSPAILSEALAGAARQGALLEGYEAVMPRLEALFERYVAAVAAPPEAALAAAELSRAARPA